ncbi:MAG: tetrahydrofolate dehydrogenase/cyclohydrolase catalytic domain-containing protein [Bacteroidota bacterium]
MVIDGKKTADAIKAELKKEVDVMLASGKRAPHLAVILVGNDGASETYVKNKIRSCAEVGYRSSLIQYPSSVTEQELIEKIHELNNDEQLDGFIVQSPLPKHISVTHVIEAIAPNKDVDGFHPINIGRMMMQLPCFIPATPKGILKLIERYDIDTTGKHAVVLGRSNIVGSPMSILLSRNNYPGNCTVTLAHSYTKNTKELLLQADIIIAAIGKPEFITGDMVKEGAVVIDVGITRLLSAETKSGYRLAGDVKYSEVAPKCSFITPVPGGVGPMTIVALMHNTLLAAQKTLYKDAGFQTA